MSGLAQRVQGNNVARQEQANLTPEKQIQMAIRDRLQRIEALMPGEHVDAKRMAASVMVEIERNPKLAQCTPDSIVGAMFQVSQAGLELGATFGQAYIIPRWNSRKKCNEATYQTGYKGILNLARRAPEIASVIARAVYEGEHFVYAWEPQLLEHRPGTHRGEVTHAYCRWTYTDGGWDYVVIDRPEIERRRDRGQGGDAWKTDFAAMAAKSAVRAAAAYLPLTTEAARVIGNEGRTITMSDRGDGMLVAAHDDLPELAPPDPETGEILREDPPTPSPTTSHEPTPDDRAADPDPEPAQDVPREAPPHSAAIGEKKGQAVHAGPLAKVPAALHGACILRASGGATWHARDLLGRQVPTVAVYAEDATADPAGFARETLGLVTVETPEAAALRAWLAEQT